MEVNSFHNWFGEWVKGTQGLKYLGSWVNSTEQDLKVRKALAWRALNGMTSVWNSNLPCQIKLSFFYTTVESVLLYGSECWTLKPALEKSLDGCYTRMLRAVLNIRKTAHVTNKSLYGGMPKVSQRIAARRMKLAGHCQRHQELPAGRLVLTNLLQHSTDWLANCLFAPCSYNPCLTHHCHIH